MDSLLYFLFAFWSHVIFFDGYGILTYVYGLILVCFDAFGLILLSPFILDSLLMSRVSTLMSFLCFSSFIFPHFFFINAKRGKYCMIALFLLLAFLLNVTLDVQTKGEFHCL